LFVDGHLILEFDCTPSSLSARAWFVYGRAARLHARSSNALDAWL
jgi:hypothetical protein